MPVWLLSLLWHVCCFGKTLPQVKFDRKNFCDSVYYVGRPYRHRAIEIIKICLLFSIVSDQSFNQHTKLLSVIKDCDEAISYAITSRSGKKESQEADDKFDEATRRLRDYQLAFHPRSAASPRSVDERMRVATENDERRKDKARDQSNDATLNVVEFHILTSLPCNDPVIVRQALRADRCDLPEIVWNFSHFEDKKRLTLAQNPHFYRNLSTEPVAYGKTFDGACIAGCPLPDKIFVPTNSSRRVFFDCNGQRQVFDVWTTVTQNTLIFKDVHGNLWDETTIEGSIGPPPFQCCRNHTQGPPEGVDITNDWRGSIRTGPTGTHICVSAPSTQPTGRVG